MKQYTTQLLALFAVSTLMLTACKKDVPNIFNMFDVKLTLHDTDPFAAGEYNAVAVDDSLVIDFTLESPSKDMYMVCLHKVGDGTPMIKIPITDNAKRRSFSGKIGYKASQGVGETSYRIYPYDEDGVYLGDGYKKITVDVASDYAHIPNRNVYFPDTVGKVMACYFDLTTGKSYSYTDGAAASAQIDFGIYRKWVKLSNGSYEWQNFLYTPEANPNPFTPYDLSGWNKKGTLFAAPISGGLSTWRNTAHRSGKAIETEAKKKNPNLTHITTKLVAGNIIYFKTAAGKYGALMANAFSDDYQERPFMNVYVKIQQ